MIKVGKRTRAATRLMTLLNSNEESIFSSPPSLLVLIIGFSFPEAQSGAKKGYR